MPSLWVDLLCLHGHIADPRLLRRLATHPPAPQPSREKRDARLSLAKHAVTSLRICLGIGDGVLRSQ